MLAVPARLRRHRLPVRLRGHARLERHAHTYALPLALAVLFALAGCGGSSSGGSGSGSDLASVCKEQRAALASAPQPVGLSGAAEVLRRVVAMNTALLEAVDDTAVVNRIQRLDVNARRGLAAIEKTDPDRSMFPLRTGAASGRRVLSAAKGLLNDVCA